MYFPYFRGRQYELIALRELVTNDLLGRSVVPVIEPIKLTSTFDSTLKGFHAQKMPFALIFNPSVGELTNTTDLTEKLLSRLNGNSTSIPSVFLNKNAENTLAMLIQKGFITEGLLTIINNRDFLDIYKALFDVSAPKYTLFPDERQIRRTVSQNKVLFEDKFNKQGRNADYPEDEFFSEDHLFFQEEGYTGFGDYSIVGDEYIESGFAPYAVAIHIVYFADDDTLRIRHFISNSNEDISDVAGKYHEAVSKVAQWYNIGQKRQLTSALSTFLAHAETGYYPGLPTVKKLSIMHHLELLGKFLDGGMV